MGDIIDDNEQIEQIEQPSTERAAGSPEGAVAAEPSHDEIAELYKATGVTAPVPTGKAKGRPKATDVRAKKSEEDGTRDSDSKRQEAKNADDKNKSKDAPTSDKNGDSGDKTDQKESKDGSDDGGVQSKPGEADEGVRDSKSAGKEDSERGRKEGSEQRAPGDEAAEPGQEEEAQGESDNEKAVKRPGKSSPEVERRIQQLVADKKAADQRADDLEKQLNEKVKAVEQAKIAENDPEYTVDDFRKVKDKEGNIHDLNPEQAELYWRRWKDGYDERASRREAEENRQAARAEHEAEVTRQLMKESSDAYDILAGLMDDYPELVKGDKFDEEFAKDAMPIIQKATRYLEGTEPGNAEGKLPIVIGLKIDPREILDVLRRQNNRKRSLPLNGINDNVESRSNVGVTHSRSSDPTANAANELYKELNIKKRF